MNKFLFTALIACISMISCHDKSTSVQSVTDSTVMAKADSGIAKDISLPEEGSVAVDSTYAFIKSSSQKADSFFIQADYIQFLTGNAATNAAKKNHEADTTYDDKGKIINIGVPDDYYIVNESKKLRILPVSPTAVIQIIDMSSGNVLSKKISLADYKKHKTGNFPVIIKLKKGEVIDINEVYLP